MENHNAKIQMEYNISIEPIDHVPLNLKYPILDHAYKRVALHNVNKSNSL